MCLKSVPQKVALAIGAVVALFAVFPLTDTDIWWHLACAREWVTTWTPVREPVVNVHEFFQQIVAFVYNLGGARLLVAFKAILWGCVFALFLWPSVRNSLQTKPRIMPHSRHSENAPDAQGCHLGLVSRICRSRLVEPAPDLFRGKSPKDNVIANPVGVKQSIMLFSFFATILFIFRYQFEIRPVLFSLIFLGIYWNILPWLFIGGGLRDSRDGGWNIARTVGAALAILALQFLWCKSQGLYILGPIFALTVFAFECWNTRNSGRPIPRKSLLWQLAFMALLFAMPFFHREGLNLFLYPFGLLDRLLGFSPSAAVFASEIAENRSPITLLMAGENVLQSTLMIVLSAMAIAFAVLRLRLSFSTSHSRSNAEGIHNIHIECAKALWLFITAILVLVAERNFVLFLPVFFAVVLPWILQTCGPQNDDLHSVRMPLSSRFYQLPTFNRPLPTVYFLLPTLLIAFLFGLWFRSVSNYDSMVAYQRVPVAAAEWMNSHPHSGRLFNDDRAGGYLAFVNPSDSTYIDGRFILKTAEFFERYLGYSENPQMFLHDADAQNMDRVVLPLRYYARWDKLLAALDSAENWHVAYRDSLFVVMDRTER